MASQLRESSCFEPSMSSMIAAGGMAGVSDALGVGVSSGVGVIVVVGVWLAALVLVEVCVCVSVGLSVAVAAAGAVSAGSVGEFALVGSSMPDPAARFGSERLFFMPGPRVYHAIPTPIRPTNRNTTRLPINQMRLPDFR